MKLTYAVIYTRGPNNYNAYAPDVPGCFMAEKTWKKIQKMAQEVLAFHIEGLIEFGEPIPEPKMSMEEAMAHHVALLADIANSEESFWFDESGKPYEFAPTLETTFGMVEVEVNTDASPTSPSSQSPKHVQSASQLSGHSLGTVSRTGPPAGRLRWLHRGTDSLFPGSLCSPAARRRWQLPAPHRTGCSGP